ncbi:hypothetical protein RCL1_006751 [Eukaryota sp. TZLM3-RCL]
MVASLDQLSTFLIKFFNVSPQNSSLLAQRVYDSMYFNQDLSLQQAISQALSEPSVSTLDTGRVSFSPVTSVSSSFQKSSNSLNRSSLHSSNRLSANLSSTRAKRHKRQEFIHSIQLLASRTR